MLKKIIIPTVIMASLCYSSEPKIKQLYYDDIDTKDKVATQEKINATYLYGLEIIETVLKELKKEFPDKGALQEECNDSLYTAIFDKTITDKLDKQNSYNRFMKDCKAIVNNLFKSK